MSSNFKETRKNNKSEFIKLIILVCVIVGITTLTIYFMPWIISLKDETTRAKFVEYIHSKGVFGVLILLGIQVVQVIVAIIPGEPIEVLAGLLYGTFYGYLICTIGMLIGTIIIYYTVRALGVGFITKLIGEKKLSKYKFMHDTRRLEIITFILFFIPGTPKDLLTYFMPITKIKPTTFFAIVAFARIPSIVSSTFAGSSIGQGKWLQSVVIFCIIGAIGTVGIFFNEKIINAFQSKKEAIKTKLHNRK